MEYCGGNTSLNTWGRWVGSPVPERARQVDPARLAGLGWIWRVEFVWFFPRGWGLSPSGGWEPSQGPTRRHLKKRVTHEPCPSGQRAGCQPVYTVRWQLLVLKPQEQDLNHKPALHSGALCSHWNSCKGPYLPVCRGQKVKSSLSHTPGSQVLSPGWPSCESSWGFWSGRVDPVLGTSQGLGEKEMATHSSTLAWRIPGMGEPGGLPSMGSHRVEYDWSDLAVAGAGGDEDLWWNRPSEEVSENDHYNSHSSGLPWLLSGKESACQCRRQWLDLGRARLLWSNWKHHNHSASALEPVLCNKRSPATRSLPTAARE